MKKSLFLRLMIIACFLSVVPSEFPLRAQPDSPENDQKLTAEQARTQLQVESKKLEALLDGIKPDALQGAARAFVTAARNPEDTQKLNQATSALRTALSNARERARQQNRSFAEGDAVKAMEKAMEASSFLAKPTAREKTASDANSSQSQANGTSTNKDSDKTPGFFDSLTGLIWPIAGGIAALGLIVLAVFGILKLRAGFWLRLDGHVNEIVQSHIEGVKRRHDELGKHLAAAAEEQRKTSSRLESIEGEIQALGRRLRQGALDGSGYQGSSVKQAFDEYTRQPVQPVEPEFPASADEYLNKMKRNSIVVKPDFQNGILVNDIDGKGELVLIRDSSIPDDAQPLFVVPRVTQFQTKQEFHSYYERYYECQKPSAGDVWIIDPAIVSTVPGGWELREKGVLEVR